MRVGEISPVELIDACIGRAAAAEPFLNALIGRRFDLARAEAKAAEALFVKARADHATDSLPPFLGVPCTIKESIRVAGMPNTVGSFYRKDVIAPSDAPAVARMKANGFIPLGVTNVPECCFWMETTNVLYGRTKNPHDFRRSVGGSSGGEGAAIAAGYAPIGLGSDIGGSIRMPAFFNGIAALKPTPGLIPLSDHWPFFRSGTERWQGSGNFSRFNAIGPMARCAEDLMPLLRLMAGPDGFDAGVRAEPLGDPATVTWRGRRVLVLAAPKVARVPGATADVIEATRRAARHFEARGAVVEELPENFFRDAFTIWALTLAEGDETHLDEMMGGGKQVALTREIARFLVGGRRHIAAALLYAAGERLLFVQPRKKFLVAEGIRLKQELTKRLGTDGLLLMPPHPRVAPNHGTPLFRPFDHAYTAILNILQVPVASVPMGVNARGLPLGVQAVAAPFQDHVAVAAALALEEEFGGAPIPRALMTALNAREK